MATFAERLKALRSEKNMTQTDLAKLLGLSTSAISMYERGVREPNFETLNSIAAFFNVDVEYLLGKRESKLPSIRIDTSGIKNPEDMSPEELEAYLKRFPKELENLKDALQNMVMSLRPLTQYYLELNIEGQKEAVKRIRELAMLSEYSKDPKEDGE